MVEARRQPERERDPRLDRAEGPAGIAPARTHVAPPPGNA